jgi:hypothetical protein
MNIAHFYASHHTMYHGVFLTVVLGNALRITCVYIDMLFIYILGYPNFSPAVRPYLQVILRKFT